MKGAMGGGVSSSIFFFFTFLIPVLFLEWKCLVRYRAFWTWPGLVGDHTHRMRHVIHNNWDPCGPGDAEWEYTKSRGKGKPLGMP